MSGKENMPGEAWREAMESARLTPEELKSMQPEVRLRLELAKERVRIIGALKYMGQIDWGDKTEIRDELYHALAGMKPVVHPHLRKRWDDAEA